MKYLLGGFDVGKGIISQPRTHFQDLILDYLRFGSLFYPRLISPRTFCRPLQLVRRKEM